MVFLVRRNNGFREEKPLIAEVEDQPTQPTNTNNLEFELKPTYVHFRGYICVASFFLGGGGLGYCFCLFKEDSLGNTS